MKKGQRGFTLFELLAVLAILAIVAGIAVPRVMKTIKNASIEKLENEILLVSKSMQRFVVEQELMDDNSCLFNDLFINSGYVSNVFPGDIGYDAASTYAFLCFQDPTYENTPSIIDPNLRFQEEIGRYVDIPPYLGIAITVRDNNGDNMDRIIVDVTYPAKNDAGEEVFYRGVSWEDLAGEDAPELGQKSEVVITNDAYLRTYWVYYNHYLPLSYDMNFARYTVRMKHINNPGHVHPKFTNDNEMLR